VSDVTLARGDTLVLTCTVSGIPSGSAIDAARIVIGDVLDVDSDDPQVVVVDNIVTATVSASVTDTWPSRSYPMEIKVKLDDVQATVGRVFVGRLRLLPSLIGDDVPA